MESPDKIFLEEVKNMKINNYYKIFNKQIGYLLNKDIFFNQEHQEHQEHQEQNYALNFRIYTYSFNEEETYFHGDNLLMIENKNSKFEKINIESIKLIPHLLIQKNVPFDLKIVILEFLF